MPVAFLSPEWVALAREAFAGLPARAGATARVHHVVTGAPGGDLAVDCVYDDGRLVDLALAPVKASAPEAVTITTPYADARALLAGELDLSVVVMQGRAKVAGPTPALLAVLPLTRTHAFRAAQRDVDERTAAD